MDKRNPRDGTRVRVPACSICENDGLVTVKLEMPGVSKDSLEIKIEGNGLTIAGNRSTEEAKGSYLLHERHTEAYRKDFTIDDSIDRDKVKADLIDGILTLTFHVNEAAKPRRIEIA